MGRKTAEFTRPVVAFVEGSLALIELKQRRLQLPNLAVDFGEMNFPDLAKAIGGEGVWYPDRKSLAAEVKAVQGRDTFALLCAAIGPKAYNGRIQR
jgi:hypothetical protein